MAKQKKNTENTSGQQPKRNGLIRLVQSTFLKNDRPKNLNELGISVLKNLPANITLVRTFMKSVDWRQAQDEVLQGMQNTVAIVGQANTGKSTLFNQIQGQQLSAVSPVAGTTKDLITTDFGPFKLIDTPGHLPDVQQTGMQQASVIVFLIDGARGLQAKDRELYASMKQLKKPIVVAVNKIDALPRGQTADHLAEEIANALGVSEVIPISALKGKNVAEELIPAIIQASPEAALVIGRELPAFRHEAAQKIIRNATLVSLAAGIEPIPLIDIPILLGTQIRLVLRIAVLYGEPINSAEAARHARELIVTMAGGLGLRYLAEQAAKAVPFGGDFVAGAIAGAATWSIGQVALEYYEGGKQVNVARLRQLYTGFYQRFRKEKTPEQLRQYALEGKDAPLAINAPKELGKK